ncbi:MAG: alpha-amylase family glycosyl hydrolase [Bacteroidota bacterium]
MNRFFFIAITSAVLIFSCNAPNTKSEKKMTQTHYKPSSLDQMVMYQVFVRNFSREGNFKAITADLSRLKAMGVNTLWLMPIQPTGIEKRKGTYGSPYAIKDYTDVHPDYGSREDFKALVDRCHALNMNIIIDHVANHTSWDHKWVTTHPDWFTKDSTGQIIPPVADWTDVADLDYENAEMRKEMIKSMMYWVKEFDIDGYRCDVAEMVPVAFWAEAIDSLNKIKPVIMLAEGAKPDLYESGFQITYGWEFYHALKDVFNNKSPLSKLDSVLAKEKIQYPETYKHIRFITNHDENSWDDIPQNKFISLDGTKAAFVISACLPGVPFVYNGQEVGYDQKINLFEKYTINYNQNSDLNQFYTDVLSLKSNGALYKNAISRIDIKNKDVYAFVSEGNGQKVLIVVNVRNKPSTFFLPDDINNPKALLGTTLNKQNTLPAFAYSISQL